MPNPTKEELLKRSEAIEFLLKESMHVEDVCERRVIDKKDSSGKTRMYLPQGKLESPEEYEKRISMTPFSAETPKIIYDRLGAIFANPPKITGTNAGRLESFYKKATIDGKSFVELCTEGAKWIQRIGFMGVLLDFPAASPDLVQKQQEGQLSQAEVESSGLKEPHAVIYHAENILDYDCDAMGFKSVKVVEYRSSRENLLSKPQKETIVRIIDRVNVTSYRIDENDNVSAPETRAHGGKRLPFVFILSPIPFGKLGRSLFLDAADFDIGATRILSDINYNLFLLGNPILTFKTNDVENPRKLGTGAGKYIALKLGSGMRDSEELAFCVLDEKGIELLFRSWQENKAQAKEAAGKAVEAAIVEGSQMSGISRAWQFKTGEERALFVISLWLTHGFNQVIDIVAEMMDIDPSSVALEFNMEFDLSTDKEKIDNGKSTLTILEPFKEQVPESYKMILNSIVEATINLSPSDRAKMKEEIDSIDLTKMEKPVEPPSN